MPGLKSRIVTPDMSYLPKPLRVSVDRSLPELRLLGELTWNVPLVSSSCLLPLASFIFMNIILKLIYPTRVWMLSITSWVLSSNIQGWTRQTWVSGCRQGNWSPACAGYRGGGALRSLGPGQVFNSLQDSGKNCWRKWYLSCTLKAKWDFNHFRKWLRRKYKKQFQSWVCDYFLKTTEVKGQSPLGAATPWSVLGLLVLNKNAKNKETNKIHHYLRTFQ